jgi:tetratricopeptide (TPR) repeat protein
MKILTVIGLLLFSLCANADDEGKMFLKKANDHYAAGRYDIAVGYYLKAAEFDETEAQFDLGYAMYHGEGIKQDYTSAVMWFKRAASKQYPKAEYNLAFCYMYGKGVPCNYDKAQELLVAAANHGLPEAQITLAECYEHGVLVEQDLEESKRWKDMAEKGTKEKETTEVDSAPPTFDIELDGDLKEHSVAEPQKKKVPVVKILFPKDQSFFHTDIVKVKYQLLADGLEESTEIKAMVDAKKIDLNENRAVKQANVIEVEVPNRDCTVTLYARNEAGNSEPVSIRLIRENVAQGDLPRLFCVAVGVGDYHDEKLPALKLATKDAEDFANTVAKKQGLPFSEVQVKLLTDKEATREDIFEALEWLQQETTPNDICIFFYAGHGYRDEKDRFYFMPYGGTTDKLYKCFSSADFKNMADDINCKMIVFADACYSAALFEGNRSAATAHFLEQLRRTKNGTMLYASSASDTKSKEDPEWGNGAFTKALISAFNGGARQQFDEGLSTQALDAYLYKEVRRITNFKQTPIFINPNGMEHFNIFNYEN